MVPHIGIFGGSTIMHMVCAVDIFRILQALYVGKLVACRGEHSAAALKSLSFPLSLLLHLHSLLPRLT